jgi:hypothetical protein
MPTRRFTRPFGRLRPLPGGEGGARRDSGGKVRWVAPQFGAGGFPHRTPTLSAPECSTGGGEGDSGGGGKSAQALPARDGRVRA